MNSLFQISLELYVSLKEGNTYSIVVFLFFASLRNYIFLSGNTVAQLMALLTCRVNSRPALHPGIFLHGVEMFFLCMCGFFLQLLPT